MDHYEKLTIEFVAAAEALSRQAVTQNMDRWKYLAALQNGGMLRVAMTIKGRTGTVEVEVITDDENCLLETRTFTVAR